MKKILLLLIVFFVKFANADNAFLLKKMHTDNTLPIINYSLYYCDKNFISDTNTLNLKSEIFSNNHYLKTTEDKISAKQIIRNAIKTKKNNKKIYSKYSVNVYVKSSESLIKAPEKFTRGNIKNILELDSSGITTIYLSESSSRLHFQSPNSIKEDLYYHQTIGKEGGFIIKKVSDLNVNFYEDMISWPALSAQTFVSPIAQQSLHFYNFNLVGILSDNGHDIFKIAITPKRKYDPTFSGFIYLLKDNYKLYAVDLNLNKNANINFVDSLKVKQQYLLQNNNWLPSKVNFNFYGSVLGFQFESSLVGLYENYNLNPYFENRFFKNEILRIDSATNITDTNYIKLNRPIPLTKPEYNLTRKYYSKADPKNEPTYLDSIANRERRFRFIPYVLKGYHYKNFNQKFQLNFDALLPSLFYNTVEGFGINYGINIRKDVGIKSFVIRPEIRYSQQNHEFNSDLSFNLHYDPLHRASVKLNLGSAFRDLNPNGSLNSLNNSLNTLLFSQNFMKLFKKEYVSLSTGRELYSGLYFSTGLELARRYSLTNIDTNNYRVIAKKNFTSNNPFDPLNNSKLFPDNTALNYSFSLIYAINQKYSTIGNAKYYETPTCPRLIFNYRKGISGVFSSSANYDFVELEVQQEKLNMGLFGYASFSLSAGKFINQKKLYFPDYKHFAGNLTLIFNRDLKTFHFLDYYAYSTDNAFIEAHYEQNLNGYFTRKIPLVRKLKLQEIIGASFLSQPIRGNYTEYYVGFERWYFRVNYAFAYGENGQKRQGFRIYYGF